jgi:Mrp family chromosome partitioning ATPase
LLLGIGAAFGLEMLDRRLIRVSTVESMYGAPVLAVLPHVRKPAPSRDGHPVIPTAFVEAVRSLRINISMASPQRSARVLLVTSAVPGEGKSTVVRDLALVCAESGEAVLVIDADLRRPSIGKLFGVNPELGLAQVLRGEVPSGQATVRVHRAGPRNAGANSGNGAGPAGDPRLRGSIDLLSYGEQVPDPVPLLSSAEMTTLLSMAKRRFNTVIVDSAPLLAVADTVPLLEMVDGVLLVARLGLTTRDSASRLTSLISRVAGVNLVGVVTNDIRARLLDERYRGYGGYGGYRPQGHDTRGRTATSRSG